MTDDTVAYLKEQAEDPRWDEATRVHDWRNYISEELRFIWTTFTQKQRLAIMRNADELASREEWD